MTQHIVRCSLVDISRDAPNLLLKGAKIVLPGYGELGAARSEGSQIMGLFAEGRFLSIPGSLRISSEQGLGVDWVEKVKNSADPYGVVFEISPEFPGIESLYSKMTSGGMPMFITHTRAGVDATLSAIKQGALYATHFYDVFSISDEAETVRTSVAFDILFEQYEFGAMAYSYLGSESRPNFDSISTIIPGNSLLSAIGLPMAEEYEIMNVPAMKIMECLGNDGSFTDYYAEDYDAEVILMGHDGSGNIKIAEG